MSDLAFFEQLLEGWREYLRKHPAGDETNRHAGFHSALSTAAEQLDGAIQATVQAADDE